MVKKSKRAVKEKQGTRLPLFLAVSLAVHSIAAVAAPAIIGFYTDKPVSAQNLAYVDVVHEQKPAGTPPDKAEKAPVHHAPAPRLISPSEALSKPKDIPASTSSKETSAPAEKPAPENAPDSDVSSVAAHAAGPIKPAGGETLVASLEKNISAPAIPEGIAGSGPGSPGDGALPAGEKVEGDTVEAGAADGAGDADDVVGVGDIKSYAGGDPLTMSSGEGTGLKSAAGFSSFTGVGPAFSPAGINIAEGTGTSEKDAGRSEGAVRIPAAKIEKAAGAGQAGGDRLGKAAAAGSTLGGNNIETGGKKMASAGMLYASNAWAPGGVSGADGKKDAGVEAIKTGTSQAAGFGHAALEAVPETGIHIKSPSDGSVIDCMESADITVAGEVKGNVDKVKVYVNGVSYEARAANGSFKIRIPAQAEKNFIYAEGYDIHGDRCVSQSLTCRIINLNPVDMVVYLNCSGAKLKVKYGWRPYPLKDMGGKERDNEFNVSGNDNQRILTVASGARGIYTIGIENGSAGQEQAEVHVCVFPRDPAKRRVRKLGMIRLGGGAAADKLVRVLLPEGVFWEDDSWFSGVLESTHDTIKYKQPEGIAWKEVK
jgi:hypothetical protein